MKVLKGEFNIYKDPIQFTHVPKTAGSSIKKSLTDSGISVTNKYHKVFTETNLLKVVSIRNPLDRFVSAYHYLKRGGVSKQDKLFSEYLNKFDDFDDFALNFSSDEKCINYTHFKPQAFWTGKELSKFDFIIRYESLEKDWLSLCIFLNINNTLCHKMKTKHQHYKTMYRDKSLSTVHDFYSEDCVLLSY